MGITLKDWYGKDQTFDHDTLFVRDENGEIVQFSKGKKSVLEPLEVTENGSYLPPEGVDGFSSVEVNVEGTGGGSLPAGVYWEAIPLNMPKGTGYILFEYNNEIYALPAHSTSNYNFYHIYKLIDGSWQAVTEQTYIASWSNRKPIEYKGKLHIFGDEETKHKVFDGTTLETKNELPENVQSYGAFIQDDKLKVYSCKYGSNKLYVWDEVNDTWSIEATLKASNDYCSFHNISGVVYVISGKNIYTYSDSELTLVYTFSDVNSISYNVSEQIFGKIYVREFSGNSKIPNSLHCYDPKTNTSMKIGMLPIQGNGDCEMSVYQNKLILCPDKKSTYAPILMMHEVSE